MMEITDNTMLITRDDGVTDEYKILFYYHNDEREKDYYFLFKEEDPDSLIVMASADGESLTDVSEEEFAECQEVLAAYEEEGLGEENAD